MLKKFIRFLEQISKSEEEIYLENAVDTIDLEKRQRDISRGLAPFQKRYNIGY